jgi:hypothetical protein
MGKDRGVRSEKERGRVLALALLRLLNDDEGREYITGHPIFRWQ